MSVIPASQEAEAGESLEPGRQRLQRAEILPLYSSLGIAARLYLRKKRKKILFPIKCRWKIQDSQDEKLTYAEG